MGPHSRKKKGKKEQWVILDLRFPKGGGEEGREELHLKTLAKNTRLLFFFKGKKKEKGGERACVPLSKLFPNPGEKEGGGRKKGGEHEGEKGFHSGSPNWQGSMKGKKKKKGETKRLSTPNIAQGLTGKKKGKRKSVFM